ncbi:MAG: PEGA domain-containing protein [Archangium sp.]|nr:PEGA domain-containing protein [Archangium sp.]
MSPPIPFMTQYVAALGLAVASTSLAAEKPRVVVVPLVAVDGASDSAAAKFTTLLNQELGTREAVNMVAAPVTKSAVSERPNLRRTPSPEVLEALEAGKKAFEDLRLEDAVTALRRGIEGMQSEPASIDIDKLVEAHVQLSASLFRLGEEKEAKTVLNDLARLSPSYTLRSGFPPVFERELEKSKKRLDKQPRGQVSVDGPPGSTAFLDGRDLGMVPVLEEGVPAGIHYVRVENERGERWGQALEVKAGVTKATASFGSTERTPINMAADPKIQPTVTEETLSRLLPYAKAAGADFAVIGVVSKASDSQLQAGTAVYSVKRGSVALVSLVLFDTDVLTANTEVFKLSDEVISRATGSFTAAPLPLALLSRKSSSAPVAVVVPPPTPVTDVEPQVASPPRKTVLVPKPEVRAFEHPSTVAELNGNAPPDDEGTIKPPPRGVPVWVWVVVGVAAAAGAGVGGYFAISNVTRPVTGTVTAAWQ